MKAQLLFRLGGGCLLLALLGTASLSAQFIREVPLIRLAGEEVPLPDHWVWESVPVIELLPAPEIENNEAAPTVPATVLDLQRQLLSEELQLLQSEQRLAEEDFTFSEATSAIERLPDGETDTEPSMFIEDNPADSDGATEEQDAELQRIRAALP